MQQWLHNNILKSPITRLFGLANSKEKIEIPQYWNFVREFAGEQWIPSDMASILQSISMSWRVHDTYHLSYFEDLRIG